MKLFIAFSIAAIATSASASFLGLNWQWPPIRSCVPHCNALTSQQLQVACEKNPSSVSSDLGLTVSKCKEGVVAQYGPASDKQAFEQCQSQAQEYCNTVQAGAQCDAAKKTCTDYYKIRVKKF